VEYPVDDAPRHPWRLAVLTAAAGRHRAWLARSGLSPRSQRTYLQQAGGHLAWLDGRPGLAVALGAPGPAAGDASETARQEAADQAARRYHRHPAGSGTAPASVKLALAAIGSLRVRSDWRAACARPDVDDALRPTAGPVTRAAIVILRDL
jgi:hypothetical protein